MSENIKYEFKENTIYCGDNLEILRQFPSKRVKLCYIDPPFFTAKDYEMVWGDGFELKAFNDRWIKLTDGKYTKDMNVYLNFMEPRIEEIYRVLKDDGSFYLHCDINANSYLRELCDRIFKGPDKNNILCYEGRRLEDEIIWSYFKVGGTTKKFIKSHDTIYRYSKTDNFEFNLDEIREPYSESIMKNLKEDEKGKYYTRGLGSSNKIKRIEKTYINPLGKVPGDVWNICGYSPSSIERLGYQTQKPLILLNRIIKTSSKENDIVLDAFAGGGTTIEASNKLNRKFIGIDISPLACRMTAGRINYPVSNIIGLPILAEDILRTNSFDFQQKSIYMLSNGGYIPVVCGKKGPDGGWDGIFSYSIPIQVKQQENVSSSDIMKFLGNITESKQRNKDNIKKGIFIALSYSAIARKKIADINRNTLPQIKIYELNFDYLFRGIYEEDLYRIYRDVIRDGGYFEKENKRIQDVKKKKEEKKKSWNTNESDLK